MWSLTKHPTRPTTLGSASASNRSPPLLICESPPRRAGVSTSSAGVVTLGRSRAILGREGGGIGAFAVHPSGTLLAVAEKSTCAADAPPPRIFLYALPSLELATAPVSGGAERGYSDINFRCVARSQQRGGGLWMAQNESSPSRWMDLEGGSSTRDPLVSSVVYPCVLCASLSAPLRIFCLCRLALRQRSLAVRTAMRL